jgi:hypothetical protein
MKPPLLKDVLLALAAMSFILILGGGMYEHVTLHYIWTAAPPRSLYMFQGSDGIHLTRFWVLIHPVVIVLLTAALLTNTEPSRRKAILITLTGYLLILISTSIYFVPELNDLISAPYSNTVNPALQHRALTWKVWNAARGLALLALAFNLLLSSFSSRARK